jgi:hypothetical protein
MGELPFLVAHGGIVWRVLVGASAVGAIALRRSRATKRARKEALASVAGRASEVTAPVEGAATVRGTLKGGSAATLVVRTDFKTTSNDDHGDSLWIDCDGQRIELAGAVRVERGTSVTRARRVPDGTPDKLREAVKKSHGEHALESVREGDTVIAYGKLSRIAGEATDYRESAGAWRIEPTDDAIVIAAATPASAPPAIGIIGHVLTGMLGGLVVLFALYVTGRIALSGERSRTPYLEPALPGLDRYAIAAATPWNRSDALEEIEHRLEYDITRDATSAEQLRAVARLRRGCDGELGALYQQDRYEDAVPVAQACGSGDDVANTLSLLGRFDEASDRNRGDVIADIGAGHWREAADALAAEHESSAHKPCLEQLFRLWGGDAGARDRLRAMAGHGDAACDAIAAFALPTQAETAAALAAIETDDASLNADIQPLAWSLGADRPENDWATRPGEAMAIRDDEMSEVTACTLLAPAVLSARKLVPGTQEFEQAHVWMANYWALRGDFAKARAEAKVAAGPGAEPPPYTQVEAGAMLETLAVRTGDPLPFGPDTEEARYAWVEDAVAIRAGKPLPEGKEMFFLPETCIKDGTAALAKAAAGDGNPLADLMTECDVSSYMDFMPVYAALVNVKTGRDRLATRFHYIHGSYGLFGEPLRVLHRAVLRRDLAHLLGDEQEAQRYQAVIDHHMAAFADPKHLIGLLLYNMR